MKKSSRRLRIAYYQFRPLDNDHRPQGRLRFTGKSQIVALSGRVLYRAHAQREQLGIVEIES